MANRSPYTDPTKKYVPHIPREIISQTLQYTDPQTQKNVKIAAAQSPGLLSHAKEAHILKNRTNTRRNNHQIVGKALINILRSHIDNVYIHLNAQPKKNQPWNIIGLEIRRDWIIGQNNILSATNPNNGTKNTLYVHNAFVRITIGDEFDSTQYTMQQEADNSWTVSVTHDSDTDMIPEQITHKTNLQEHTAVTELLKHFTVKKAQHFIKDVDFGPLYTNEKSFRHIIDTFVAQTAGKIYTRIIHCPQYTDMSNKEGKNALAAALQI